jgi:hypothetical protein
MSEVVEGNSPTPNADTPLAPTEPATMTTEAPKSLHTELLKMITKGFQQMGDLIDYKLNKVLAPIKTHLKDLETGLNAWDAKYSFNTQDMGNMGIKAGINNDTTPEQQQLLAAQQFTHDWDNS